MSSALDQSSTTDAQDVESTYDRYNVNHGFHRAKGGEESKTNKSVSFQGLSVASSSFDSKTYGTSYMSDGSETLERDEFFDDEDYLDIDNLSLESQPMVMDRFVDSACSCLDHPAVLYQKMCLGAETSLLRQSKVRSPSTNFNNKPISPNLGMASAKRRNHLVRGKNIYANAEVEAEEHTTVNTKRNEIQIMRIQPKEFSESTQNHINYTRSENARKEVVSSDSPQIDDNTRHQSTLISKSRLEDTIERNRIDQKNESNEDSQSISNGSKKSMVERAIQKVANEDRERGMNGRRLETLKDTDDGLLDIAESAPVDIKIDPPSDFQAVATRDGQAADSYPTDHSELELSRSNEAIKSASKKNENSIEVAMDPSGRSQLTRSQIVTAQKVAEVASQASNISSRNKETEIASDEDTSLFNDLDVIDVLSMDDQDSWIPGSRNEIDNSFNKNTDELHHMQNAPSSPSPKNHETQDNRTNITNVSGAEDIWVEEEEKLKGNNQSNGAKYSRANVRTASQTVEDLWNEERMKLQTKDGFSDDTKTLLRQYEETLHITGINAREILRSQSRRQRIRKALKDRDGEDFISYKISQEQLRSKSLGRNPPSPEILSAIQQIRNDKLVAGKVVPSQPGGRELSNVTTLPSRKKDLVAVRSIEEGQRIRSAKRNAPKKYNTHSHHKANADIHGYAREMSSRGPYDERSNRSRHNAKSNPVMKKSSSRRISKTRDPIGTKRLTNFEESAKKYQPNDERDDQESLPSSNNVEVRPASIPSENKLSDHEIAISATKELRKLEKKIERQLRRADLDSKTDQSKEIRRIEKKLSKKLRSIKTNDMDAQVVSSREIRRLEKQLAQKMSGENENRASKLKRIKRKGGSSALGLTSLSMKFKEGKDLSVRARSSHSGQNGFQQTQNYMITPAPPSKSFSDDSEENLPERHRHENPIALRSRYLKRGIGRRMYSKVPDSD